MSHNNEASALLGQLQGSNRRDILSREEIRAFTKRQNWRGWWTIARTWLIISACFALLAAYPNPLTFVVAVFFLGGQHLACAIVTHEASHRSLFTNQWLNDVFADWVCARPIWVDVLRYRKHHMRHHSRTGTAEDPDMSLIAPFPSTPAGLLRKLFRDLIGITGLRRMVGLVLMDIGRLKYTVASDVTWLPKHPDGAKHYLREGLKNMGPMLISNGVIFAVLYALGIGWVYSAWVVAYLTTFSLFIRIRSIAEHACLEESADMFKNTRTTYTNLLTRLTVAPCNVNYHQEHHLLPAVPYYNLPKMHARLLEKNAVTPAKGYWDVLRLAAGK